MRARVEKVDVLGWNKSSWIFSISSTDAQFMISTLAATLQASWCGVLKSDSISGLTTIALLRFNSKIKPHASYTFTTAPLETSRRWNRPKGFFNTVLARKTISFFLVIFCTRFCHTERGVKTLHCLLHLPIFTSELVGKASYYPENLQSKLL